MSNLAAPLFATAARSPARIALNTPDGSMRYDDLAALAGRFAGGLATRGIGPGDTVSIWMENGWRWVAAYYGALAAGCIVNPLNPRLTLAEIGFIVRDCGTRFIVTGGDPRPDGVAWLDCSPDGFDALLGAASAAIDRPPGAIAHIAYTSGTTGFPKGARLSHDGILLNATLTADIHGRTNADMVVSALPLTHVYGNIVLHATMLTGATLVTQPRFEAQATLDAIRKHGGTVFDGVPAMYAAFLNTTDLGEWPRLRLATVGGQGMPPASMQAVEERFGCPLIELWGMTELGGLGMTHARGARGPLGTVGKPLPGMQARIVALDDPATTLADGLPGELHVRGKLVMGGYHKLPDATAATITTNGWLRTGDVAVRLADGHYRIVDRIGDTIVSGGYNIYPAELERVIACHPAVAMVAVGGVADARKGEVPRAYIVRRDGWDPSAADIVAHCRTQLASYKLPLVAFVPDLPRTSTGKIMRRGLQNLGE